VALLRLPIATLLCASSLFGLSLLNAVVGKWPLLFTLVVPMLLFRVVVLNLTEEIGWMGFLQDRLQEQHGPLKRSRNSTLPSR
jgi:membrane protease YdiL (CAAX protease family)